MFKLTKCKIIEKIAENKAYDIDREFAAEATKNIECGPCARYSRHHYEMVYVILRRKLETMSDKDEKIAYLNCLVASNRYLSRTDDLKAILSLITGVIGGGATVSFFENENLSTKPIWVVLIAVLLCIILGIICRWAQNTRRWDFKDKIYAHLKSTID